MTKEINEIAAKHLGRSADGQVHQVYKTPIAVDPSLLVGIPRHLNRTQYRIFEDSLPFIGFDTWHGYEVSFMNELGLPINCVVKIVYSSSSPNIVESKSLKLYLNSYNMHRFEGITNETIIKRVQLEIQNDLMVVIGGDVSVGLFDVTGDDYRVRGAVSGDWVDVDQWVRMVIKSRPDVFAVPFKDNNENPDLLGFEPTGNIFMYNEISDPRIVISPVHQITSHSVYLKSSALRSNCRVTNQPDWGDVYIKMSTPSGKPTIDKFGLIQYLVSMRNENHFHEEVCECIFKRLFDKYDPDSLTVACLYTRRGGIDINPIRSTSKIDMLLFKGLIDPSAMTEKTIRQ